MTFAYFAGWRVSSEILPLQWALVDRQTKTIRLEPGTTKNAEGRTLPHAQPELVEVIETAWREHERLAEGATLFRGSSIARRFAMCEARGWRRARRPDALASCCTTFDAPPFVTSCALACLRKRRWELPGTRPGACSTAKTLLMRRTCA